MKTAGTLLVIASVGLLAGCSNRAAEPTGGTPTAGSTTSSPATTHFIGAVATDITPGRLFSRPPLAIVSDPAYATQALSPTDGIGQYAPVATQHLESFHRFGTGTTGTYKIPVDTTDGEASLFINPLGEMLGAGLDDAIRANVDVLDPNGVKVNARQPRSATDNGGTPMSWIPLAGHPAGLYTVSFHGPGAMGTAVEGRFAASNIVMTLKPSSLQHLLGGEQYVDATLTEAGKPILGAHVTSELIHGENTAHLAPITFAEVGGGVYRAAVHPLFNEGSAVSAYLTDVDAAGVAPSGAAFQRHGQTGFHFGIPTARVVDVVGQRQVTDSQGLISGLEVDVQVESSALDRLEISAKLTAMGTDGNEHPVSIAHYGQGFQPGKQIVTLHFDASNVRMTRMEGDFMVRDLQIFSLGTNTVFAREAAAHNRVFQGIARAQLVKHETFSPAQQELVRQGVLFDD